MRKNVITILAIGSILLLIAAGVFLFAGMQKNQTEPKNWKDDFRWFNCKINQPDGSKTKIEVGVPLIIIDWQKANKFSSDQSPAELVSKRFMCIKNYKVKEDLIKLQEFYMPPAPNFLDKITNFQPEAVKDLLFIKGENGIYVLLAVICYQDLVAFATCAGDASGSYEKATIIQLVTAQDSRGNWRVVFGKTTDDYAQKTMPIGINGDKLLYDCWKKVYGKDFAEMYPFDDKNPVAKPEKKEK